MITLDRLKLVASIDSISILDPSAFETNIKDGQLCSLNFYQQTPFLLRIKIDYVERELVVEFTGKVLLGDYPKLISEETIEQCFFNINALGFCKFDIDKMMESEVVSCDVTKDIECDDVPQLCTYIKSHIRNYNSYSCKLHPTKNLTIEKNVITRKCKKRMIIYDKGEEMSNASNRDYVRDNHLEDVFDGKCRFELNLNCKKQIRESLNVSDTSLRSVLSASANPIADFVEAFMAKDDGGIEISDRKSYMTMLVLKDNDFDIEKVEAKMRTLYKRGTKFSEVMKPYRDMLEQMKFSDDDKDTVSTLLRQLR